MKVLFIDSNHPSLHTGLEKAGFQCDLRYDWSREEILRNIHAYEGVVIRSRIKFTGEVIDAARGLKFIARVGAGMENIDVAYAESKGITCLHAPEGNRDAVAEHAVGMLLSLFNNLCRADREVREGKWIREGNRGVELQGRTVGIIGYGNMGSAFAQRLKGFGVKVFAYDKYKKGFGDEWVEECDMQSIFSECDVLSLHIPLTEETHYLVGESFIHNFRKNFYLINTARGKCVDTAALVRAMDSGKVLGACLDVLEYEAVSFEQLGEEDLPAPFQYLVKSGKVMLSPHIGGWTHESHRKLATVLVEKITRLFQP